MKKAILLILVMILVTGALSVLPAAAQDEEPFFPAWDGQSRFTILVMGMDRRPGARDTLSVRTDVMILASIDPATQSIGMLHIPRDIHLTPVGTIDFIRANTLMVEGENLQEGYGPYYAMDTIQYNLGIYVDRYVAFDFEAFMTVIDALGGVEITSDYVINDPEYPDMNYGFDPFYLSSGTHLLDGHRALQYARTRHGDNDFVRGLRQLEVIEAVFDKVTGENMLPYLIGVAPTLLSELDRNIYTDLRLPDMIQLAQFMVNIPRENIHADTINLSHNMIYTSPDGSSIYIPDRANIAELLAEVFGENYYTR
ncbi:MAG: LCP family protein [Aggregatilineales bacterium]